MMIFKHRCVQDLAWVIQSPPVISGTINDTHWLNQADCHAEYQACLATLLQLDQNPQPLRDVLADIKPYVIGKRFECFVRFWLNISPNFDVLDCNLVLQNKQQTLGEVDFFIRHIASHKIIHLEVAVKFYLGINDISQMHNWYGTSLRDRLDIKFTRLVEHQTQLAHKFPELMPYPIDAKWCLFKGRMFYPNNQDEKPTFFAQNCPQGNWLIVDEQPKSKRFMPLSKQQWLTEITNYQGDLAYPPTQLDYSCCMAEIQAGNEINRSFFLPQDFWERLP